MSNHPHTQPVGAEPPRQDARPEFRFAGSAVPFSPGATLAAALTAAGIRELKESATGPRGIYCGIGVCQECLVTVDGVGGLRACMTTARAGMRVTRQPQKAAARITAPGEVAGRDATVPVDMPQLLVVGAGPAGLTAAATAAELGAEVVVVDERSTAGGQYFKQPESAAVTPPSLARDRQIAAGRRLIERVRAAGAELVPGALVWGAFHGREIVVAVDGGVRIFRPGALIVAAGAHERAHVMPGWTLPGVMTTGAAQTLLRRHGVLAGRRVLLAGNGPLNLQVAMELARAGAEVVAVAELAARPGIGDAATVARMTAASPRLTAAGLGVLARLRAGRVPVFYDAVLGSVAQRADGLRADLVRPASGEPVATFDADAVCTGYGFAPNNELTRLLGCAHRYDPSRQQFVTERDADCATTVAGVYAIGDCCGLGGAAAAQSEGIIAAAAAARALGIAVEPRRESGARRSLARQRRFQAALWTLFRAPPVIAHLASDDTPVCRCENVTAAQLEAAIDGGCASLGQLKRATRLGMGACQGRYCVPVALSRLAERCDLVIDEFALPAPRPPLRPVRIDVLTRYALDRHD